MFQSGIGHFGMNGHATHSNNIEKEDEIQNLDIISNITGDTEITRSKILGLSNYSSRLEEVLLALLREQQIFHDKLKQLKHEKDHVSYNKLLCQILNLKSLSGIYYKLPHPLLQSFQLPKSFAVI